MGRGSVCGDPGGKNRAVDVVDASWPVIVRMSVGMYQRVMSASVIVIVFVLVAVAVAGDRKQRTEIRKHIHHVVPVHQAIVVPIQYLEPFAHLAHLRRGQL